MKHIQFIGSISRRRRGGNGGSTPDPVYTPNGNGEGIEFDLPAYEMRVGTSYELGITPPVGYSVTWAIQDAHSLMPGRTPRVLLTGTGTTASWTPTTSIDLNNRHLFIYITAIVTNGPYSFMRRSKKIRVAPAPVTSEAGFNEVWDFSANGGSKVTYYTKTGVNMTNYKIGVKGTAPSLSAWLGLQEFVSNNPDQPVTIQNVPGQKAIINHTGTNYGLKVTLGCQNLFIDGGGDPNIPYGIEFHVNSSGAQIIYIEGWGSSAAAGAKNIAFNRIYCNGHEKVLGAGIEIATQNTSGVNYDSGFSTDGHSFTDCFVEGPLSEGNYMGRFTDNQGYAPITHLTILRMHTKRTGADGIQVGLARESEISECTVEGAGFKLDDNHSNAFQLNPGNKNVYWFRNKVLSATYTLSMNSGIHAGNQEIFSNLFVNNTANMETNIYLGLSQNQDSSSIDFKIIHNTIISPSGNSTNVPFYIAKATPSVTTVFNKLILADNVIINKDTVQYGVLNNPNLSEAVIDNYITTNSASPMFQNYAAGNYNVTSLSSPVFQSVNNAYLASHPLAAEDIDGYRFERPVNGAYSGIYLMT